MPVQTTYATEHASAYAGQIADMQLANVVSKLNAEASDTIPYGKGVVRSGEGGAILPTSGSVAADIIGVAVREMNRAYEDGDTFGAPVDRDLSVMTAGAIWVKAAEDGIVAGQPAFLRVGATNTGDFANDVGSAGTLSVAISGAKFLTGGNTGELVLLSLAIGG